jgi:acyl-coenzyme A synthetase/AMP-(fatty) acid ligase
MQARGGAFFVMYGQTEAGSRICVLPPDQLPARLGSVGPPVPGMRLSIKDDEESGTPGTGEVICQSVAVMMGYADRAEDLARPDELHGTLRTGDRGRLDPDGYLWLSGRSGRIGKAYGVRVNLDAVEHIGSAIAPTAALAGEDRVLIWCEGLTVERLGEVAALVSRHLRIHHTAVRVCALDALPRRPNGKVDYDALPV